MSAIEDYKKLNESIAEADHWVRLLNTLLSENDKTMGLYLEIKCSIFRNKLFRFDDIKMPTALTSYLSKAVENNIKDLIQEALKLMEKSKEQNAHLAQLEYEELLQAAGIIKSLK